MDSNLRRRDVKISQKGSARRALIRGRRAAPPGTGASGGPSNYGVAINLIKPELMYSCSFRLRTRHLLYLSPAFTQKFEIQVNARAVQNVIRI